MYKSDYSTKKITYDFNKKYYFVYYKLADQNNKIRIIKCFYDLNKTNRPDDITTIDIDDIKYKDYGKIPLNFIEGIPSDEILKEYLKKFKTWMCSAKINPIF